MFQIMTQRGITKNEKIGIIQTPSQNKAQD